MNYMGMGYLRRKLTNQLLQILQLTLTILRKITSENGENKF
ncbi:Uncharacterised protein [Streptococcus pyogenes]|nr:Uncharacterised protein [Streptococcus pyogenes]